MAKIIVLTADLIAIGRTAIAEAIATNTTAAAEDIIVITTENAALTAKLEKYKEELDVITAINENLQAEVENLSKQPLVRKKGVFATFEASGNIYEILVPGLSIKGVKYTAEQIAKNPDVQNTLITRKSGSIRKA